MGISKQEEGKKLVSRMYQLRTKFGISLSQYEELLKRQDERCAICQKHYSEFNIRLAVDHDHHTGEIRGLLCNHCNHRVLGRHRDANLLRRMADYVERGTGWFVPERKQKRRRKNRG